MKSPLPPEPIVPVNTQSVQQSLSIDQAMQQAAQLQSQGHLQQAEGLLRQILQQQPQHPFALHLLGVIAFQCGQIDLALDLIKQAIDVNGSIALFHSNYGEMLRQNKQLDEAIRHLQIATELNPQIAMAHSNLGIAWFDKNEFEKAEACQTKALALEPNLSTALNNMGSIHRERKELEEAIEYYQRASNADPQNTEPLNNMGAVYTEMDKPEQAVAVLQKALVIKPDYADAICNLGFALNAFERYDQAIAHFQKALELRPEYPEAHIGMARSYQEKDQLSKAEEHVKQAIALDPSKPESYVTAGSVYAFMGHGKEAHQYYDEALKLDPENDTALLGKGHLRLEEGDIDGAEELFKQSMAYSTDSLAARFHLVQAKKVREGDENLAALLEKAETIDEMSPRKAISMHFALGKCFDDLKQPDKAFPHFLEGCRLKRSTIDYDPQKNDEVFDRLISTVDAQMVEHLRGHGNDSVVPIFVLGVPRSGTTLTEQIIASHPDVYGAGELFDLLEIAHRRTQPGQGEVYFPDNLKTLSAEQAKKWADDYVTGLMQRAPDAKHITDKMPANFTVIGLIHALLPNAKIVHVKRNPIDTSLSCFTRLFQRGQDQTYDLAELGKYYVNYDRTMKHWRSILPDDAFLDVQYEELVADNEAQARRLIDYCGLEWNDACLNFHKTKRSVRTASVTQVRKPIYTSSVERWRRYEKYLGPLIDALGDLVEV